MNLKPITVFCLLLFLLSLGALAVEPGASGLHVLNGWARATPIAGVNGAGYLKIENSGSSDDVLLGASAELAGGGVELHDMSMTGGIMRMRALSEGLKIPAGSSVELAPGGTHLMLLGVRRQLVPGEKVPVILRFAKAGSLKLELKVEALTPGGSGHPDH